MNDDTTPLADSAVDDAISRRDFLARSAKAGITIAAAGGLGAYLVGRSGRTGGEDQITLGDYSVPAVGRRMAVVNGDDRADMVQRGLAMMGGLDKFIAKGDRVVLKVNAAFASAPALSATANPELVGKVVEMCRREGAREVIVTDNPINSPVSCFELSGIGEAARRAGAKLVLPKESFFKPITVPGGRLICNWPLLYGPLEGADKLIGITPVKDHSRSGASMTMKNWYGLLGGRRNKFHQDIHNTIKELAMMVRPTMVILDGTVTMMHNGPTGGTPADLKQTRTMILSTDQVAADAYGATLLGRSLTDLPFIGKAEAAGVGIADYQSLLTSPQELR